MGSKSKRRYDDDDDDDNDIAVQKTKKQKKIKKSKKEQQDKKSSNSGSNDDKSTSTTSPSSKQHENETTATKPQQTSSSSSSSLSKNNNNNKLPFDYKYIVAPMVGASELPFRLLCRKYGAQLVYTPMMLADQFVSSQEYRTKEFQTTSFDWPLVCHFAANTPTDFANAAKLVEHQCDAIDLNLGCPQRTAYVGHFGSYLLDPKDRQLVLDIVTAGANAVSIPIFVKIRLLDTIEMTLELVRQLYDAGASLVAVHGRYRASFERKGPGARDGPALLDQIQTIQREACPPNKVLITNGNTITYDDVVKNLESTNADGIMSAEGILDNPALYLERLGSREEAEKAASSTTMEVNVKGGAVIETSNDEKEKYLKKLQKLEQIKAKKDAGKPISEKEQKKLSKEKKLRSKITKIDNDIIEKSIQREGNKMAYSKTTLAKLYEASDDKVQMALEYLHLVRLYPAVLRTVIFHTRRILKVELTTYQLMEECLSCKTVTAVETVVKKIQGYQTNPGSFQYDLKKAQAEKEALERKKQEEGKRKRYEARMIRKAKREGKTDDLEFYLRQGAAVPTKETIEELRTLSKEKQLALWKEREHSQHCMAFHLEDGCPRGRTCAFLHAATQTSNMFDEKDEVAG